MPRLIHTASFRLALLFGGVFMAAVVAVLTASYLVLVTYTEWQLEREVTTEIAELEARHAAAGTASLEAALAERVRDADWTGRYYLLQSPRGEALQGNLPAMAAIPGWQRILPPGNDPDEMALASGTILPTGHYLLTAVSTELLDDAAELVWTGALWTVGITTPLAFLGGYLMSGMVLRRIGTIVTATTRIHAGDLAERIPISERSDEFDMLAGNINAMLDGLERLTESVRQVSSGIAHDLRTPLGHLRQSLERLQQSPPDAAAHRETIAGSIAEVDQILVTFEALLRIGEIDAGTRRSAFTSVDLSALCEDLAEIYAPVASESGRRLETAIEPGVTIEGDRALLVQMLTNLIENAIQHTPEGTSIRLELAKCGQGASMRVVDDGPGIAGSRPGNGEVAVPGYGVDRAGERSPAGSGLGLSIVEAIARLHGLELAMQDNSPGLRVEIGPAPAWLRTPGAGRGGR